MSYGRGPPPDIQGMVSLKVDNLTYRTSAEDLRRTFEKYGDVGDVYIPRDRFTRESRGFAFIRFYDKRDADDAIDALDGTYMDGRELRVQNAKYGRPNESSRDGGRRRRNSGGGGGGRRDVRRSYSRSRSRSRSRSPRRRRSRSRSPKPRDSRSRSRSPRNYRSRSPRDNRSRSPSRSRSRSPPPE